MIDEIASRIVKYSENESGKRAGRKEDRRANGLRKNEEQYRKS